MLLALVFALFTTGRWSKAFHHLFIQVKRFAHVQYTQNAGSHEMFFKHWRQVLCIVSYILFPRSCVLETILPLLSTIQAGHVV